MLRIVKMMGELWKPPWRHASKLSVEILRAMSVCFLKSTNRCEKDDAVVTVLEAHMFLTVRSGSGRLARAFHAVHNIRTHDRVTEHTE